jgi:hypothetical protein
VSPPVGPPQVSVSGHGRFRTNRNGHVAFALSNDHLVLDRWMRLRFRGVVEEVTGQGHEAALTGTGRWNGRAGYVFVASVIDNARRGKRRDTIEVVIQNPRGAIVFTSFGPQVLKRGDIAVTPTGSG